MKYNVEDISPVRKKITITVPVEEVEASLSAAIAMYRTSASFDGFRKGKVPSSMIEKRFGKEIYNEATTDLVNVHINEIIGETKLTPVSRINFDGEHLKRGEEFIYSINFDIMPAFEVPHYEGFKVNQEETVIDAAEVESVIERLRSNMAENITIGKPRKAQNGDIATVDFYAEDEKGERVPGVNAESFQIPLGDNQTLPDFEKIITTLKPGDSGEGPVSFPDDFFNPEFAGKTVTMKVVLHSLQERILPELNDDFAKKTGGAENMEQLRETIRNSYKQSRDDLNKATAQKELLDNLLKMVEFPLPESMVENNINMIIDDVKQKLERQGKAIASLGKTEEEIRTETRPEAEMRAKSQVFLMGVAKKLEINVSEHEVDVQLQRIAMQAKQDFKAVKDYYAEHNLLFALRDRIMADKAMDAIYEKAEVEFIAPKADHKKTATKKTDDKKATDKKATDKKEPAKKTVTKKEPAKKTAEKDEPKDNK